MGGITIKKSDLNYRDDNLSPFFILEIEQSMKHYLVNLEMNCHAWSAV